MMKLAIVFVLTCVALGLGETVTKLNKTPTGKQGDAKVRTNLIRSLMRDYDRGVNPDSPNARFGLYLRSFSINEETSTMDSVVWLRMMWQDSRLSWDTKVFPIETIRVDSSLLWHPDILPFSSAEVFSTSKSCSETNAVLFPSGEVIWIPPCNLNTFCKTTLKTEPFAPQVCPLKFGSWTYDSYTMDVNFFNNDASIDVTDFMDLSEWKLLSTNGEKHEKIYPCCEEPYVDLTFNVTFQRKPAPNTCPEKINM